MAEKRIVEETIYEYTKVEKGTQKVEKWFAEDGTEHNTEFQAKVHEADLAKKRIAERREEIVSHIPTIKLGDFTVLDVEGLYGIYYLSSQEEFDAVCPWGDLSLYDINDTGINQLEYPGWYIIFRWDGGDYKDSVSVYPFACLERDMNMLTETINSVLGGRNA